MNGNTSFDVVIVGGGMVGATMACAIAKLPLRIAIIEAFPFRADNQPSYDARSIALAYGSKRIFDTLGLWPKLSTDASPIKKIHVSSQGEFGVTRLDCNDEGLEALGYVIENRLIGNALLEHINQHANIELICPATLASLSIEQNQANITININNKPQTLSSKLLIAADGGNSKTRELLGIETVNKEYGQTAIISNVTPGKPHQNIAYERFTAEGPIAVLPMTENRCSLVYTVRDDKVAETLALDDQRFLSQLETRFGFRAGGFSKTSERFAYPLSLMKIKEHYKHRAVIIGNAAHTLHPIAGQGFNLGIRDVSTLAEVIANSVNDNREIGSIETLKTYQQQREHDQKNVALITDSLATIFSNKLFPLTAARSKGLILTDLLPPVKHNIAKHAMGLAGRLPKLSRGLSL